MTKRFTKKQVILLISTIIGAFLIRLLFLNLLDYNLFKQAGLESLKKGLVEFYSQGSFNYSPGYLYILNFLTWIYKSIFSVLRQSSVLFNFLIQMPAILADIGIGVIIFFLMKKRKKFNHAYLSMIFYLFNPAVLLSSIWLGKAYMIGAFLLFASLALLLNNKEKYSFILLAISCFVQIKFIFFFPLFLYIVWKNNDIKGLIKSIGCFLAGFFVLSLPFIFKHQMLEMVNNVLKIFQTSYKASYSAPNLWWLISGGQKVSENRWFLSLGSYKAIGLILFVFVYSFVILFLHNKDLKNNQKSIYFAFSTIAFSFFILLTGIRVYYIVLFFAFMVLILNKNKTKLIIYHLISLILSISLISALIIKNPQLNSDFYKFFNNFSFVIIIFSIVNLFILGWFLYKVLKQVSFKKIIIGCIVLFLLLLGFYIKYDYSNTYLSDLKPIQIEQAWGDLKVDRSVAGYRLDILQIPYFKGLGTHANSKITYDLNNNFAFFKTSFGLDTRSFCNNKAQFIIKGDEKTLYKSKPIKHQTPKHIKVLVKDINQLSLITKGGGDGIKCDHTNWINPILIP